AHVAAVGVRRERGGGVHRAAVVPDDEIVLVPVVAIDEAVLRGVGVELLNQSAALVRVQAFYADAMPADEQRIAGVRQGSDDRVRDRVARDDGAQLRRDFALAAGSAKPFPECSNTDEPFEAYLELGAH